MGKLNENSYNVFNFVKAHESESITAKDIAAALDLDPRQVNGILTAALQRHRSEETDKIITPLIERVEGEIELETEDGKVKHQNVNFIRLTDAGREFEPELK